MPKLANQGRAVGSPLGKLCHGCGIADKVGRIKVEVEVAHHHKADNTDDGADPEAPVDAFKSCIRGVVGTCLYGVGGDDGTQDTDAPDQEGGR